MKRKLSVVILSLVVLSSCTGKQHIKNEIEKILEENPQVVINSIKKNPELYIAALNEAAREASQAVAKQRLENEEKQVLENMKNPIDVKVTEDDAMRGNKNAPITIVTYSDFQCPFCTRGNNTINELNNKYKDKIRFVFKHLPLDFHPQAMIAAQYFEAIKLQDNDKAFAFHDEIFKNQRKLEGGEKFLKKLASSLSIDMKKLEKDLHSKKVLSKIEGDIQQAHQFGFNGTPGFILNGIPIKGAYPSSHFEKIIGELVARKSIAL